MSNPTNPSQSLARVCARCAHDALLDDAWRDLGFSGRPNRGSFFNRLVPRWRIELEKRVVQEFLIAFTAAHTLSGWVTADEVAEVVSIYTSTPALWAALGYSSREHAIAHLTESIAACGQRRPTEWAALLCSRLNPLTIPDKEVSGRIIVGCVRIGMNLETMVTVLKQERDCEKSG
jgi:hypothetical protein